MKIAQMNGDTIHWITPYQTLVDVPPHAPNIIFKEVPDEVMEGWVYDAATDTYGPPVPPVPEIEVLRAAKFKEIGDACTATIYAGVEVNNASYSLTEHDQIELMAQLDAVKGGAPAVPYHANGELCRMFPAAEFAEIAQIATAHIFYHRTYCNHMNAWIRRADSVTELNDISYGAVMPADLELHMQGILAAVGGGA